MPASEHTPSRATVERELRRLTGEFAAAILRTLGELGVWETLDRPAPEPTAPSPTELDDLDSELRRVRRTKAELEQLCARVLAVVRQANEPIAISAIAARLGMSPKEVAHPLVWLQQSGGVRKSGSRRGTRYEVVPKPSPRSRKKRKASASGRSSPRPIARHTKAKAKRAAARRPANRTRSSGPARRR